MISRRYSWGIEYPELSIEGLFRLLNLQTDVYKKYVPLILSYTAPYIHSS